MTAYELQVQNTGRYNHQVMNLRESEGYEILAFYIPSDLVHEKINNLTEEGIDEG